MSQYTQSSRTNDLDDKLIDLLTSLSSSINNQIEYNKRQEVNWIAIRDKAIQISDALTAKKLQTPTSNDQELVIHNQTQQQQQYHTNSPQSDVYQSPSASTSANLSFQNMTPQAEDQLTNRRGKHLI